MGLIVNAVLRCDGCGAELMESSVANVEHLATLRGWQGYDSVWFCRECKRKLKLWTEYLAAVRNQGGTTP